ASSSRRARTASVARDNNSRKRRSGTSRRSPTFSASRPSLSARRTSVSKPRAEKRAPEFSASVWTTSWFPRCSKMSVTAVPICGRAEIASMCAWVFVLAISIRSLSLSRAEAVRIGSATAMLSSRASRRTTSMGALWIGARRRLSSGSALDSILLIRCPSVVEDADLLVGQPVRIGDKQVSDAPQRIDAFVFRSTADRFFQLDNKGLPHAHGTTSPAHTAGGGATVYEEVIFARKG